MTQPKPHGQPERLLDEATRSQLKEILSSLEKPVRLLFFSQRPESPQCKEQRLILEEVVSLSDRLKLERYDFVGDTGPVQTYRIDKIPATAVIGEKDYGIRLYGITMGYEFSTLVESIVLVSSGRSGLPPEFEEIVRRITQPVHIEVMTTLTCPYCPAAVYAAEQLALANDHIRVSMVEASEFPTLAQKYNVSGVPKTIINGRHYVEGSQPVDRLFLEVLRAVSPEEFNRLRAEVREARSDRKTKAADDNHIYEVAIVGGGPAAMSAAVYTARKELDVVVIAREIGGQVNDTATVDNYLGLPGVGGKELTDLFRGHMERHPVALALGDDVERIWQDHGLFIIRMKKGVEFRANAVIYCAGKEYRRLGIERENEFIGRGIAFCATCDAPLYKGRKVAVVGGGNSAFTAVRDLVKFASEIHLIHRRDVFTADAVLQNEVRRAANVKIHPSTIVKSVIGGETFEGVVIGPADGSGTEELRVDGMFLEIGLTPNSAPVKTLLVLNEKGEIPVGRRNETALPGFYAAGDVTDVFEKQICIAVGDGAKAALAAHEYLLEHRLTQSRVKVGDAWE